MGTVVESRSAHTGNAYNFDRDLRVDVIYHDHNSHWVALSNYESGFDHTAFSINISAKAAEKLAEALYVAVEKIREREAEEREKMLEPIVIDGSVKVSLKLLPSGDVIIRRGEPGEEIFESCIFDKEEIRPILKALSELADRLGIQEAD